MLTTGRFLLLLSDGGRASQAGFYARLYDTFVCNWPIMSSSGHFLRVFQPSLNSRIYYGHGKEIKTSSKREKLEGSTKPCSHSRYLHQLTVVVLFYDYCNQYNSTGNRRFPSCLSSLFQSESWCKAFHMEISFIHTKF